MVKVLRWTILQWRNGRVQRLSLIFDGFNENDMFNVDEMDLVYRATLNRFLVLSKQGRMQKWKEEQRKTYSFIVFEFDMNGKIKTRVVIDR